METTRNCPICHTPAERAKLFLEENIDKSRISDLTFASRKEPEFMCYRLVQCPTCDLVYANQPPDQSTLAQAYHVADFDSAQEADDAAAAYDSAVQPILTKLKNKEFALEIGTGTGTFLEKLKTRGFKHLIGIEPSSAAIAAAPDHRRLWIREDIFRESDFPIASFDFICCFMTLEHVRDPSEIVSAASRLLKPGGAIALVTHDYRSAVNRMLGPRSPIIDIEHMQLFSRASIETLLKRHGFESIEVNSFRNRYALRYWLRLLPMNVTLKHKAIKVLETIGLADTKLTINVGNMLSFGYVSDK